MTKGFFDVPPSYPLVEREEWRTLIMESESGVEEAVTRWTFPRREWDLIWRVANRVTEVEPIRDFIHLAQGRGNSFFWKEPNKTSRKMVYIATGNGSSTNWIMPVWSPESFYVQVNSQILQAGVHYSVLSFAGQNSFHILSITSISTVAGPPPGNALITFSYINGYYCPIVRIAGQFETKLLPAGDSFSEIAMTFRETKEDMPNS